MKRSFVKFETRLRKMDLYDEVARLSKKHRVTLVQLYEGEATTSVAAARRSVYAQLGTTMSGSEIARLFDRARSGVCRQIKESANQ